MDHKNSRAPKQLGDFGEGLVMYTLIRKGYEVACVDHVGADLIAHKDQYRIAVSVKTRMYREGSCESQGFVFEFDQLKKLEYFAKRFDLKPVMAHAACIADNQIIHLFILRVTDIYSELKKIKRGYSINYSRKRLKDTIKLPCVDYSCWSDERITKGLFEHNGA